MTVTKINLKQNSKIFRDFENKYHFKNNRYSKDALLLKCLQTQNNVDD